MDLILSWLPFPVYKKIAPQLDKKISDYLGTIIDPIVPSTITLGGRFTNFQCDERNDIGVKFIAKDPIMLIGSNYGESFDPNYVKSEKKVKTSNRGRKPKPKEPKKRIQGSGKYFNSQITFEVKTTKIYKVKVFRNGVFQIPGVLNADQRDSEAPLTILRDYFQSKSDKKCEITDKNIQLRNCKTIISDPSISIDIYNLGILIDNMAKTNNTMNIFNAEYQNAQSSYKIIVKFSRPTEGFPNKQTTLKILKQKINFEGAVNFDDVLNIYWWINDILIDNYDKVIIDGTNVIENGSSSDEDSSSEEEVEKNKTKTYCDNYYFL